MVYMLNLRWTASWVDRLWKIEVEDSKYLVKQELNKTPLPPAERKGKITVSIAIQGGGE
jgi:hypothetical protein